MSHLMFAAVDIFGVVMTIIGLGALIFFHELGHFLACRLTGTRVEVFSIGFGKEIVGWERGGIRYRISLIPLGGYVKMAAENPGEARTDAPDEFPNKSFSQRLFIMANGVIFNVILAFVLFVAAFGAGVPFRTTELGQVGVGAAAWRAGLQAGDVVTHIGDRPVLGFSDLQTEIAFSGADEALRFRVLRDGEEREFDVRPEYSEAMGMPAVGVAPAADPAAADVIPGSPIAQAGGRPGDVVVALNDIPVDGPFDLQDVLTRLAGLGAADASALALRVKVRRDGEETVLSATLGLSDRPQVGIRPFEGTRIDALAAGTVASRLVRYGDEVVSVNGEAVSDLGLLRARASRDPLRALVVRREGERMEIAVTEPVTVRAFTISILGKIELESTRVAPRPGMPAARAGLLPGDTIVRVGDAAVAKWSDIPEILAKHGPKPIQVTVDRPGGETRTFTLVPGRFPKDEAEPLGYRFATKSRSHRSAGIGSALAMGWHRTVVFTRSVVMTIRGLLTRRVSARHIGGPIALATVTYQMFDHGWGRYFYILAIISINLAILNMLPIPVLDGGQIVLLCAEKIRGKPLPDRVVGYYQMVGLALILCLLLLAFRNDLTNLF